MAGEPLDGWPEDGRSRVSATLRFLVVFVVVLVLPLLLMAATITAHEGCGGG